MVPTEVQQEALAFLSANVFTTPTWLLDTMILARVGDSPAQIISKAQDRVLNSLLSTSTVTKLAVNEALYGDKAYRLINYFNDIDRVMWTEL